ncbi:hypothetical protein BX600DRAFT_550538 [Xylariales sp. PMI_506]|nr:hypothetical protein BX600DRAFT_550538 [Xylariales sp. PMI_506]
MIFTLVVTFATTALAFNATGPWAIQVTGKEDSSINGYASACHSGAAIEALCYEETLLDLGNEYADFYYNYTSYDSTTGEVSQPGLITWLLPYNEGNTTSYETEALQIELNYASNVNAALFYPGDETGASFYYYPDNGTLYIAGGVDDSSFNATEPEIFPSAGALTNFYLCWQYIDGYYYQSIAWVTSSPPHNPSCEPVNLSLKSA